MFQQLVIASLAVSTVTTLEAAAKWPDLVWLASALFFGVAGTRARHYPGKAVWPLARPLHQRHVRSSTLFV